MSLNRSLLILIAVYFLMFWSDVTTFRPGMDSMTYGAIARHMLESGDWFVPHYNEQAYANFFQHPPLGLWLMAASMGVIRFLFGNGAYHSDLVLKFLPSAFAGICALIVYFWARKLRGESVAFWATLVLLTSTRFVKFSKGFMLDPFLATFSLLGLFLSFQFPFLAGLSIAAALLSKGLFAFAPLAVILLFYGKKWRRSVVFISGVLIPLVAWFLFGDATNYIHHYYTEHVAGRIGPHPLSDHVEPLRNLVRVYWPWLPFFIIGCFVTVRARQKQELAIGLTAFAFLAGFVFIGSFLEQYHVSFYPFAAIIAGIGIPKFWLKHSQKVEKALLAVVLSIGVFMIARPAAFHSHEFENPLRVTFSSIRAYCPEKEIRRIMISNNVAEIWYALAIGSWYTDYDTWSGSPQSSPEEARSDLLLALFDEAKSPEWEMTSLKNGPYTLYRRRGTSYCR